MHIGLIGLGTMGENLARNAARNGATVAVYNRTVEKMDAFMQAHGKEGTFIACRTLEELLKALPTPRTILLMVHAGDPVDQIIAELLQTTPRARLDAERSTPRRASPFGLELRAEREPRANEKLQTGDVIIDGGNSHFQDTERRQKELSERGIHLLGMGVSGGEAGALLGPSMMPGGPREDYDRIEPLLQKMAANDGAKGRCVTFIGSGGSGHFVKMVHNGIEYGDMQLIAEAYHLLKAGTGMSNEDIGKTFGLWKRSRELKSFLIEITENIFKKHDDLGTAVLLDVIKDEAKQKGTGKWTTLAAFDLGLSVPTITAAVDARSMSARKGLRVDVAQALGELSTRSTKISPRGINNALFLSKICSYAQGFYLIAEADKIHGWGIDLAEVCRIWKGGCIIRSALLKTFEDAFRGKQAQHLLAEASMLEHFSKRHAAWRKVIANASLRGIPTPAMSASLAWFDSVRSSWLPQNLTQAQRDYFGAHTYERIDRPGVFHTEWK